MLSLFAKCIYCLNSALNGLFTESSDIELTNIVRSISSLNESERELTHLAWDPIFGPSLASILIQINDRSIPLYGLVYRKAIWSDYVYWVLRSNGKQRRPEGVIVWLGFNSCASLGLKSQSNLFLKLFSVWNHFCLFEIIFVLISFRLLFSYFEKNLLLIQNQSSRL